MENKDFLCVKQIKSSIRCTRTQRCNLKGLGLNKIGSISILESTPSILGMIKKVNHLVSLKAYKE